jgi:putative PEP-CTERM system TPR-repeat lipoprotein
VGQKSAAWQILSAAREAHHSWFKCRKLRINRALPGIYAGDRNADYSLLNRTGTNMSPNVRSGDLRWKTALAGVAALVCGALVVGACSRDPQKQKEEYVASGDRFAAQEQYAEAVVQYRNAIQIDQKYGQARAKLAAVYEKMGDARNALNEYVRAADLLPDDTNLQLTAGHYLIPVGRVKDALARAESVLKREPDNVEAHVLRGNALGGLENLQQAVSEMEEAIRLDPSRGTSHMQLGLVELARGNQAEAEAALKKAVALSPKWVGGRLALANFYWTTGKIAEANKSFQGALELEPLHEGANRAMAIFSVMNGRMAEAEQYLRRVADGTSSTSATYALADYYLATGRAADAVARLQPLVAAKPNPDSRLRLARALAASGDSKGAESIIDVVLKLNPTNAQAQVLRSQLQLADGRRDAALASARAAVTADPNSAPVQFALGQVYAARGDASGAEKAFREVLRINPRASAAQVELSLLQLNSGAVKESVGTAEEAVKNQPNSVETRLALTRGLLISRDFDRAEKEIGRLLAARPQLAAVHVQAGVLAAARNNPTAARSAFEKAMSLDSNNLEAFAGLLALELNRKEFDSARQRLQARLAKTPVTPPLLLLSARTYASMGDAARSEEMLRKAIETEPTLLAAYAMLGQLYVSQGKLDQARQEFDTLAERQSNPVGALTMSGVILQGQGQSDQAIQRYERAIAADSRAGVAANNLAWLYAERGERLDQAVRMAEAAAAAMPDSAEVLDTLGWVYYKSNLYTLAIKPLAQSVEKDPKNPIYHYHLGLAYAKQNDPSRARRSLGRALEIQRDFPGADEARRTLASLAEQVTR